MTVGALEANPPANAVIMVEDPTGGICFADIRKLMKAAQTEKKAADVFAPAHNKA